MPEAAAHARVGDEVLETLPENLYIPPDALKVLLSQFEGPLDLLLWLIRKNKFNVLDIPISEIARQYEHYIEVMRALDMELAAEYLFMAAWLAEIKSRMLLPKPALAELEGQDEEDPRTELMARLLQYEGYKQAAQWLEQLTYAAEEIWPVQAWEADFVPAKPQLSFDLLCQAFGEVMLRQNWQQAHQVVEPPIELEDKLHFVLTRLQPKQPVMFVQLLVPEEGKIGAVVTFMALLELLKQRRIRILQNRLFEAIQIERVL